MAFTVLLPQASLRLGCRGQDSQYLGGEGSEANIYSVMKSGTGISADMCINSCNS